MAPRRAALLAWAVMCIHEHCTAWAQNRTHAGPHAPCVRTRAHAPIMLQRCTMRWASEPRDRPISQIFLSCVRMPCALENAICHHSPTMALMRCDVAAVLGLDGIASLGRRSPPFLALKGSIGTARDVRLRAIGTLSWARCSVNTKWRSAEDGTMEAIPGSSATNLLQASVPQSSLSTGSCLPDFTPG